MSLRGRILAAACTATLLVLHLLQARQVSQLQRDLTKLQSTQKQQSQNLTALTAELEAILRRLHGRVAKLEQPNHP